MYVDRRLITHFEWMLPLFAVAVCGVGIATVYSATHAPGMEGPSTLAVRQGMWFAGGCVGMLLAVAFDYRRLDRYAYLVYGAVLVIFRCALIAGEPQADDYEISAAEFFDAEQIKALEPVFPLSREIALRVLENDSIGLMERDILRDLIQDRLATRADLRDLLSERVGGRDGLRDLLSERVGGRDGLRDLILERLATRGELRDLLGERTGRRDELRELILDRLQNRGDLDQLLFQIRSRVGGNG